jgi:hypothetical protein
MKINNSFSHVCHEKKQPIPSKDDKPIMGILPKRNYIMQNIVSTIITCIKHNKIRF